MSDVIERFLQAQCNGRQPLLSHIETALNTNMRLCICCHIREYYNLLPSLLDDMSMSIVSLDSTPLHIQCKGVIPILSHIDSAMYILYLLYYSSKRYYMANIYTYHQEMLQ